MVGIGANLGDRFATIRDAVARIDNVVGLDVTARSNVYETLPMGGPPQPPFLNAALLLASTLAPLVLLDALLQIEGEFGRTRGVGEVRFGPRTLDLDVLWIEGVILNSPRLLIPHPRMHERAFAIVPLLDVVPGAIDPRSGACFVAPVDHGVHVTRFFW